MSKNVRCCECRNQMSGWDGGFFGEPVTCECRIYGVTKGRKSCSKFKKRITKSDLLNKIQYLEKENEQLRQENVRLKDDAQYYKTKSARLEEELLSIRGHMYE